MPNLKELKEDKMLKAKLDINKIIWSEKLLPPEKCKKIHKIIDKLLTTLKKDI